MPSNPIFRKLKLIFVTFTVLILSLGSFNLQTNAMQDDKSDNDANTAKMAKKSKDSVVKCADNEFKASYFDNTDRAGIPVSVNCESKIDFNWGKKSPQPKVHKDNFSAIYEGFFDFEGGKYDFNLSGDDKVKLFLDDKEILLARWEDKYNPGVSKTVDVKSGKRKIKATYTESIREAFVKISWNKANQPKPPVTTSVQAAEANQCRYQWCPIPYPSYTDPSKIISEELQTKLDKTNENEKIRFYVNLADQADLTEIYKVTDRNEQGKQAYSKLVAVANQSQAPVISALEDFKKTNPDLKYYQYYIVNSVLVESNIKGAKKLVSELTKQSKLKIAYFELEPNYEPSNYEYGTQNIKADLVHQAGNIGQNVVIGILDSGVRASHQDLVSNYRGTVTGSNDYNWYDPSGATTTPNDCNGHGTHVAGTAVSSASAAGVDPRGTAPGVQWIASSGISCGNFGTGVLGGMQFMFAPTPIGGNPFTTGDATKRPNVVNNSWGSTAFGLNFANYGAVNNWRAVDILPVFAAGNSGPANGTVNSPANYDTAFAVGAVNNTNNIANFSSRGGPSGILAVNKPDISAPGVNIKSTWNTADNAYNTISGTSMAAPHTTGCVALVKSSNPALRIAEIEDKLKNSATDLGAAGIDGVYGSGLINCQAAITQPVVSQGNNAVGDLVFSDTNQNGLKDPNESGVAGVTVRLLDGNATVLATTTTNNSGYYKFINLVQGNSYMVEVVVPANTTITTYNADGAGLQSIINSDILTNGRTPIFTYQNQEMYYVDAGIVSLLTGTIYGTVWKDTNQDGSQFNELGGANWYPGLTMELYEWNPVTATLIPTGQTATTIGSVVSYSFPNLNIQKQYKVKTVMPAGWVMTIKDNLPGDDIYDSDFDTVTFYTDPLVAVNGQFPTWTDAGLYSTSSIGNQVWNDTNSNGLLDNGETGINGVTVSLTDQNGNPVNDQLNAPVLPQVTANAGPVSGFYRFSNLNPGQYKIKVDLLPNYVFTNKTGLITDTNNSDIDAATGLSDIVTLVANDNFDYIDAGLIAVCPAGTTVGVNNSCIAPKICPTNTTGPVDNQGQCSQTTQVQTGQSCPAGLNLIGNGCYGSGIVSYSYSCPSGGQLQGTTCVGSSSYPVNLGDGCWAGGTYVTFTPSSISTNFGNTVLTYVDPAALPACFGPAALEPAGTVYKGTGLTPIGTIRGYAAGLHTKYSYNATATPNYGNTFVQDATPIFTNQTTLVNAICDPNSPAQNPNYPADIKQCMV